MKPRITASYIFKMVEGPMSPKPREVAGYVCDEFGSDSYVRREGSRGKQNRDINFYAIAHCYCGSKRLLPHAIKSRMTTLLKNYSPTNCLSMASCSIEECYADSGKCAFVLIQRLASIARSPYFVLRIQTL